MHAGNKTDLVQKMSPPVVKQAAYGETRAAIGVCWCCCFNLNFVFHKLVSERLKPTTLRNGISRVIHPRAICRGGNFFGRAQLIQLLLHHIFRHPVQAQRHQT